MENIPTWVIQRVFIRNDTLTNGTINFADRPVMDFSETLSEVSDGDVPFVHGSR